MERRSHMEHLKIGMQLDKRCSDHRSEPAARKAVIASALLLLYFTAPTAHAASFDCKKARTAVENMICADAELSKLDKELSTFYKTALGDAKTKQQKDVLRESQKAWLKSRDACTAADCVRERYARRLRDLTEARPNASGHSSQSRQSRYPDIWDFQDPKSDPRWRLIKTRRTEAGEVEILFRATKYGLKDRTTSFFSPGRWSEISSEDSSKSWGGIFPYDPAHFSGGSVLKAGDSRGMRSGGCYSNLNAHLWKYVATGSIVGHWYVLYVLPKPVPYVTKPECNDGPDFVERVGALSGSLTGLEDDTFLLADRHFGLVIRFDSEFKSKSKLVGTKVFVFTQQAFYDILGEFGDQRWQAAHDELHRILTTKAKERRP